MATPERNLTPTRPAETAGAAGTVGLLVSYALGVHDPQTVLLIGAAVGLMPAAITWLVSVGGVRGGLRRLWRGA